MARTVKLKLWELEKQLQKDVERIKTTVRRGIRKAAGKGKPVLIEATPIDLGQAKRAWEQKDNADGSILHNGAPYAAILDRGARPHPVSREGFELIKAWITRHITTSTEAELESITWAICTKIKNEGQEPKWFVKNSLPELLVILNTVLKEDFKEGREWSGHVTS